MTNDEEVLEAIKSQRAGTQRQVKRKAQQVISPTVEEEDNEEDECEV